MSKSFKESSPYELVGEFVSIYRRPGSSNWYAYYRHDGKAVRASLQTKHPGKARRRAWELEKKLQAGATTQPRAAVHISEAVQEYMAYLRGMRRSAKTIVKYEHCFRLMRALAAERGIERLDQVEHRFIDAFRNQRSAIRAPKTVSTELVIVRQLINFGLKRAMLADDPLKGLELRKPPHRSQPYWTKPQTDLIVAASQPPYQQYYRFLADTGVRASEAIWLTWEDVDSEKGVIRVRAKGAWRPKTGDERVIPMSSAVRDMLSRQPRQWRWVFTAKPSARYPQQGRQISDRRALSHLKTVLKRLGLKGHQHTFRHSFISHALTSGVAESIVRGWVGHVDRRIMDIYTHIADAVSKAAMKNLFATDGEQARNEPTA